MSNEMMIIVAIIIVAIIIITICCFSCMSCFSVVSLIPMFQSTNSVNGYRFYENVAKMGSDQKSNVTDGDTGGCIDDISVNDATVRCNKQYDCEGFFVYDSKNSDRVCFKTKIDTNNKTYTTDVFKENNPNCGYFVKE